MVTGTNMTPERCVETLGEVTTPRIVSWLGDDSHTFADPIRCIGFWIGRFLSWSAVWFLVSRVKLSVRTYMWLDLDTTSWLCWLLCVCIYVCLKNWDYKGLRSLIITPCLDKRQQYWFSFIRPCLCFYTHWRWTIRRTIPIPAARLFESYYTFFV